MFSGVYEIASGMMLESARQELTASNLSGVGLAGFKGRHLVTSAEFSRELNVAENDSPELASAGTVLTDHSQGALKQTGRVLDFALMGEGFFRVLDAEGDQLLTRNGTFMLSPEGGLQTPEGYRLQGANGDIFLGTDLDLQNLVVHTDGTLSVRSPDGENRLGTVDFVKVKRPEALIRLTANYFRVPADQNPVPAEKVELHNACVEQANVTPVRAMAMMMDSVRNFEINKRVLQMLEQIADQERKIVS